MTYLLFTGDANVDALCSQDLQSPLHCAASRGHADVVMLLLERSADCNIRNLSMATPLHHAAMGNHVDVCVALLNAQADPAAVAQNGWTPSLMAYRQGHVQCGKMLDYHLTRQEAHDQAVAREKADRLAAMTAESRASELAQWTSKEKAAVLKAMSLEDRDNTLAAMTPEQKKAIHDHDEEVNKSIPVGVAVPDE